MKVRDLNHVIDSATPIRVNYSEYFGELFDSYEEMRRKTNILGDDEIKRMTVGGDGALVIDL